MLDKEDMTEKKVQCKITYLLSSAAFQVRES